MDIETPFPRWIRIERLRRDLSILELAKAANISPKQLWNIEKGHTSKPGDRTVNRLLNALSRIEPKIEVLVDDALMENGDERGQDE